MLNNTFIQNVTDIRGDAGKVWLEKLPALIKTYEDRWNIKVGDPFTLSYNYVACAITQDNTEVVIKIGFPGDKELIAECEALKLFDGDGAIKLLNDDISNGVLLLERVMPGLPLQSIGDDEKETKIACQILKKLHRSVKQNDKLIYLGNWLNGFTRHKEKYNGTSGPFSPALFSLGEELEKKNYHRGFENSILLHGDFHHNNILSSHRDEWLVIDSKGVIGQPLYDVGVFLNNPQGHLKKENLEDLTRRRIEIFSQELHYSKQEIIEWGITQAILGAIWSLEDHGIGWEDKMQFAQLLTTISV